MGGSVPQDPPAMRDLAGLRLQESFGASVPKADTDQERFAGLVVSAIARRHDGAVRCARGSAGRACCGCGPDPVVTWFGPVPFGL
jgi:hypothetical protein